VLVLDHSGSMSEDSGDGTPKVDKLKQAVSTFAGLMLPGDGLGIVRVAARASGRPVRRGAEAAVGHEVRHASEPTDLGRRTAGVPGKQTWPRRGRFRRGAVTRPARPARPAARDLHPWRDGHIRRGAARLAMRGERGRASRRHDAAGARPGGVLEIRAKGGCRRALGQARPDIKAGRDDRSCGVAGVLWPDRRSSIWSWKRSPRGGG
jgi:hypothetical protein